MELIEKLGYPVGIFQKLSLPGTVLGNLKEDVAAEIGYGCKVVIPATHDTGSAVMAVPAKGEEAALYISSGTWSLMGTELRRRTAPKQAESITLQMKGDTIIGSVT